MKILIYTIITMIISLNAYGFNEECIDSEDFPFCLYIDGKQEFLIIRNEKEVGWHKVEFSKTNDGYKVESTAYIKARYLLFFLEAHQKLETLNELIQEFEGKIQLNLLFL